MAFCHFPSPYKQVKDMIEIKQPLSFTQKGRKDKQEDSLFPLMGQATAETPVFLVCDGMGGHDHGEVASQCVAETMGKLTTSHAPCTTAEMKDAFNEALEQAYVALDESEPAGGTRTMGTTLTFLARCTDGILIAHIGDSRIYQLRPGKGIMFHTRDHSLVNDLVAAGEITEEEARTHPRRNVITRALMPCHGDETEMVSATFKAVTDIQAGDIFFMCCDGVIEKIDDNKLQEVLLADAPAQERMETLAKLCRDLDTRDNNTCYFIEIDKAEGINADASVAITEASAESVREMRPLSPKRQQSKMYMLYALIAAVVCGLAMYFIFSSSSASEKSSKSNTNGIIKRIR